MIISNPTLGAGNGKIGGLVGWARGSKQILRQNAIPIQSELPYVNLNRLNISKASAVWQILPDSRKNEFKTWAGWNNLNNGFILFSQGYTKAMSQFIQMGFVNSWVRRISDFNPNFFTNGYALPNWVTVDYIGAPCTILADNARYDAQNDWLQWDFYTQNPDQLINAIDNGSTAFGLMVFLNWSVYGKNFRRLILNCGQTFLYGGSNRFTVYFEEIRENLALIDCPLISLNNFYLDFYLIDSAQLFQSKFFCRAYSV